MPPKTNIVILENKRDNALSSLYEVFEEFEIVTEHEPELRIELIKTFIQKLN